MATNPNARKDQSCCASCGKNDAKSICSKCKFVSYCGPACQRADWEVHKIHCRPFLEGVACCDVCSASQDIRRCCCNCGAVYCRPCYDGISDCHECQRPTDESCNTNYPWNFMSLKALADKDIPDKRRSIWFYFVECGYLVEVSGQQDIEQAKQYAEKAGKLGYGESYNMLGSYYVYKGDRQEAKKWFEKATALNCAEAFLKLGGGYYSGDFGGSPDYNTAKTWFEKGARLGNAACYDMLGDMYREAEGMEKNLKKAAKYYQKGAERGNVRCQLSLGLCYAAGEGVPQCHEQARYWWEKVAAQQEDQEIAQVARMSLLLLSASTL